jgi:hypothetical protein
MRAENLDCDGMCTVQNMVYLLGLYISNKSTVPVCVYEDETAGYLLNKAPM